MTTMTRRGLLAGAALGAAATTVAPAAARGSGRLREYWLAIEPFRHVLAPTGRDLMTGRPVPRTAITALRYRAYTAGWRRPLPASQALGPNNGMPGPTIRARVGDRIRVHLRNDDHHYGFAHSIHPHGVFYRPSSDGAYTAVDPGHGGAVEPGRTRTYDWVARPDSVGTWPYHDHSRDASIPGAPPAEGGMDMGGGAGKMELGAQLGLFGVIAITDRSTPIVDREIVLFFHDLYADDIPGIDHDWDCFNGYAFLGNTPTFRARRGERVRWRVAALGTEFHVFHVHGHRWRTAAGEFQDSALLGPSTTLTVDWREDNPGRWLYHCHVVDHMMGGMVGHYEVR